MRRCGTVRAWTSSGTCKRILANQLNKKKIKIIKNNKNKIKKHLLGLKAHPCLKK